MERLELTPVLRWIDHVQFTLGGEVLRDAGIPCDSHGTALHNFADPFTATTLDRMFLRVRVEDSERARALLRDAVDRGVIEHVA